MNTTSKEWIGLIDAVSNLEVEGKPGVKICWIVGLTFRPWFLAHYRYVLLHPARIRLECIETLGPATGTTCFQSSIQVKTTVDNK